MARAAVARSGLDRHPSDQVVEILRSPERRDAYLRLVKSPEDIPYGAGRADLIVRWLVIGGSSERDLQSVAQTPWVCDARHYLTVMTAMRETWGSPVPNDHLFERRIVAQPPQSLSARRAALENLGGKTLRFEGTRILIAAMPKSASSYLSSLLVNVLGQDGASISNRNDPVGVSFDQHAFLGAYRTGAVLQSHLDANYRTLAMVRLLRLKPVVQTRNIFDALSSYADHLGGRIYPGANPGTLTVEQRRRLSILRMARHYVDLFASWSSVPWGVDLLWIDYEDVRNRPAETVRRILGHVGLPIDGDRIDGCIRAADVAGASTQERKTLRLNKGTPGRGAMFTAEEKAWVRALYAEYPGVDFSRIDGEAAAER